MDITRGEILLLRQSKVIGGGGGICISASTNEATVGEW